MTYAVACQMPPYPATIVALISAVPLQITQVALMYNPETYGFYDIYLQRFQREARWSIELTRVQCTYPRTSARLSQTLRCSLAAA